MVHINFSKRKLTLSTQKKHLTLQISLIFWTLKYVPPIVSVSNTRYTL